MYIDFDEYPRYSGKTSEIFEKYVNENIKCEHGYAYSSSKHIMCTWVNEDTWEIMKKCFPVGNQIKKRPKNVLCKEYTNVQKDKNGKMRRLIPQQILNKISSHHILLKNQIIRWKLLK